MTSSRIQFSSALARRVSSCMTYLKHLPASVSATCVYGHWLAQAYPAFVWYLYLGLQRALSLFHVACVTCAAV